MRELTQRLFSAYTVDGGAVHLAGCQLEDRLFIQMADSSQTPGKTLTVDETGRTVEEAFTQSLGMSETVDWVPPPEMPPQHLEEIVRRSSELARQRWGVVGELDAVFIWCKYVDGKLRFTIGDHSEDVPFSGWTRTLQAPPFPCPHSGKESFHIAATDDGLIVAAESIATCSETGRRVLADQLVTCDVTGQTVLPDLTKICPITERPVLQRTLVTCAMCSQRVSPKAITAGRCLACRSTRPVGTNEPPMPAILEKYENLNRWPKWAVSQTAEVYVLIATGWWKRLLLVIDKANLEVRHAATGQRLSEFTAVAPRDLEELA